MAKKAVGGVQGKQGAGIGLWLMMGLFVAAVILVPAVAALLIVGLAPTVVSWLANQSPNRQHQLLTVLAFNLAGVMPYMAKVVYSPRGLNTVMEITGNVFAWLVMYGAAAAAMIALLAAPQLAAMVLQMMAHDRLRAVDKAQNRLIDEWGESVTGEAKAD